MNNEIREITYDTTVHLFTRVTCPPCGERRLLCEVGEESREEAAEVVAMIQMDWHQLWRKAYATLKEVLQQLEIADTTEQEEFDILIRKSGGWIDDDFFLELRFDSDDLGWWSLFFKDGEVIHAQSCN